MTRNCWKVAAAAWMAGWLGTTAMAATPEGSLDVYWDGGGDGVNWSSAGNWTNDTVPTSTDVVVLENNIVAGSYTVVVDTQAICRALQIGYTANTNTITLRIPASNTAGISTAGSGGPAALTIPNIGFAFDTLQVLAGGVLENNSGHATTTNIAINNGISVSSPNNKTRIKSGGKYIHNSATSFEKAFPYTGVGVTTFESGSTLELGQDFNTAGVGVFFAGGYTLGHLTLSGTGFKIYDTSFISTSAPLTIAGNLTIPSNASVKLRGDSGDPARRIVIQGNIVNNGTIACYGSVGGVDFDGTTILSGTGETYTTDDVAFKILSGRTLTIASGHEFWNGEAPIAGAGALTVAAGATFVITNPLGMNAQVTCIGPNTFSSGANYTIDDSGLNANMFTGTNFPPVVNNLRFSQFATNGTITLSAPIAVNGVLDLYFGRIVTTTTNTLTVNNDAPTAVGQFAGRISGDGYIRTIDPTVVGTWDFHVGTATAYAPVSVSPTAGSTTGTLRLSTTDGDHPNVANAATSLNRYWTLTPAGITGFVASLSFTYVTGDAAGQGVEANYVFGRHLTGPSWQLITPDFQSANVAVVNGISSFSDWTLGEAAGVPVGVSGFAVE